MTIKDSFGSFLRCNKIAKHFSVSAILFSQRDSDTVTLQFCMPNTQNRATLLDVLHSACSNRWSAETLPFSTRDLPWPCRFREFSFSFPSLVRIVLELQEFQNLLERFIPSNPSIQNTYRASRRKKLR